MGTETIRMALLIGALLLCAGLALPALAENRTAGGVRNTVHDKAASPEKKAVKAEKEEENSSENVLDVNFAKLESRGLLTKSVDGSLGRDLWNGTKRSLLVAALPQMPGMSEYRTMQTLSRRLLLTQADAELIRRDEKPQPGSDLMTLRLEKLLEMGAFKEALTLYTGHHGEPYHERFAKAGVYAALYSRESSLACLEAKAVEERFIDVAFWQQMAKICTYILSKPGSKKNAAKIDFPESKIIQQIIDRDSFRFSPRKPADLLDLEPLEAAVLAADKRFDLSGFEFDPQQKLPPHVLALFMDDPSLSGEQAFRLMIQAVEAGLKSPQDLADYYDKKAVELFGKNKKKTSLIDYQAIAGWKRLPYLYRAATNAGAGREQSAILKKALELVPQYGTAALWPLADIIALMDPGELESPAIREGFVILAETGERISPEWAEIWYADQNKEKNLSKAKLLTFVAYSIGNEFPENTPDQDSDFKGNFEKLDPQEKELLQIVYEKLDKQLKLHNYDASDGYEKTLDLTKAVDYVMPSISLRDALENAESEQRLGEIVLLSSIALRDAPPDKLYAGMFREVIDGLVTVGLTKEAQSLAREVILGLSINKGEN